MSNNLNIGIPHLEGVFKPSIVVIGVGGAGGNAVNNMISSGLEGVEFVAANTDAQALSMSKADHRLQLGPDLTKGLGAGSDPNAGRSAAEEVKDIIRDSLNSYNMVFVTAGMGGGTGTGAAPVIANLARDMGLLTVGVITKPFHFEGERRMETAEKGISELQPYVDTLIIIPNQNLFRLATDDTTFMQAFAIADEVLHAGVRGITDLMVKPGLINLDFADIRSVMREMGGKAQLGTGEAEGEKRAEKAAQAAICNPLLEDNSMKGARAVLINVSGSKNMGLLEVEHAANFIKKEVDSDASIIFGTTIDEDMGDKVRVSIVATGIETKFDKKDIGAEQEDSILLDKRISGNEQTAGKSASSLRDQSLRDKYSLDKSSRDKYSRDSYSRASRGTSLRDKSLVDSSLLANKVSCAQETSGKTWRDRLAGFASGLIGSPPEHKQNNDIEESQEDVSLSMRENISYRRDSVVEKPSFGDSFSISSDVSDDVSNSVSSDFPNNVSGNISSNVSSDVSDRVSSNVSDNSASDISSNVSSPSSAPSSALGASTPPPSALGASTSPPSALGASTSPPSAPSSALGASNEEDNIDSPKGVDIQKSFLSPSAQEDYDDILEIPAFLRKKAS